MVFNQYFIVIFTFLGFGLKLAIILQSNKAAFLHVVIQVFCFSKSYCFLAVNN